MSIEVGMDHQQLQSHTDGAIARAKLNRPRMVGASVAAYQFAILSGERCTDSRN